MDPQIDWNFYYNYAMFNIFHQQNCCLSPIFCQKLNSQRFAEVFSSELVDLTVNDQIADCLEHKKEETSSTGSDTCSSPTSSIEAAEALDFKLTCENCKKNLTSKKRYENHLAKCNNKSSSEKSMEKPFPCGECFKRFMKKNGLIKHMRICHDRKNETEALEAEKEAQNIRSIFHSISRMAESDCHQQ